MLKKQFSKKYFQTKFNNTNCLFFYRSRTFSKKKEVAECLKAWLLYVLKILTLILHMNLGIVIFPFKLANSVAKFLKKDIAEPLMARIMYLYKILKITYLFFLIGFCLWVGHMHAFDHYKMELQIVLQEANIQSWLWIFICQFRIKSHRKRITLLCPNSSRQQT